MTRPSLLRRRPPADEAPGDPLDVVAPPAPRSQRFLAWVRGDDVLAQFARFVLVGGSTTVVYALLFVPLEGMGYLTAHLIATAVSTVLANELHRRLTFHAEERVGWFTAQWEAGGVTVVGLVATSVTLGWLDTTAAGQHVEWQVTAVVTVTAIVGLLRFIALRWIFRGPSPSRA